MNRQTFLRTGLLAGATLPLLAAEAADDKPLKPFYIPPDPEPLVVTEGFQVRIKVRGRDTNQQVGCVELGLAPKTIGPVPHKHEKLDELMYVHRGEVHVLVGDEVTVVKAGGYHLRPHGFSSTKILTSFLRSGRAKSCPNCKPRATAATRKRPCAAGPTSTGGLASPSTPTWPRPLWKNMG